MRKLQMLAASTLLILSSFGLVDPTAASASSREQRLEEPQLTIEDVGGQVSGAVVRTSTPVFKFVADYSITGEISLRFESDEYLVYVTVDYSHKVATFSGRLESSHETFVMNKDVKGQFRELLHLLQLNHGRLEELRDDVNGRALETLGKTVELLALYDLGRPIDVTIVASSEKGWTSLCSAIGQSRTAYWDNDLQTRFQSFTVGGHGVCKGRCGAGCPFFGDPSYTQDCLNHDACAGEEGEQFGVCSDEWTAASDDFLFAPDCT